MVNLHDTLIVIYIISLTMMSLITLIGIGLSLKYEYDYRVLSSEYRLILKELLQLERERDKIRFKQEDSPRELSEVREKITQLPNIQHVEPKVVDVLHINESKSTEEKDIPKSKEEFENALKSMCTYIQGNYSINKCKLALNMHECNEYNEARIFTNQYTIIAGKPYLNASGVRYIEELPIVESLQNDIVTNTLHIIFRKHYVFDYDKTKIIPIRIDKYQDRIKEYKDTQIREVVY